MTSGRPLVVSMVEGIGRTAGGAERLAVDLACALDPARYEAMVCATRWNPDAAADADVAEALAMLAEADVPLLGLERGSRADVFAWRPLLGRLRGERETVIHAHMFGSNAWGAVLGRLGRASAIVAHEHMWSFEGNAPRRFVDRHVIGRLSDIFLTVSDQSRERMIREEGVDAEKLVVMRNGIPERPPGDGARARAGLGIDPAARVVGTVGRLSQEKALEVLVAAAVELAQADEGLRVIIVGEGEERARLEGEVDAAGLTGTVLFTGARLDVPDLLAAMDVAVCCSDWEGAPLSVMEYMQAGVPMVATDVGGLPELIGDGVEGLLVPPRAPDALAGAIQRLLSDGPEAERLAANARERQQREMSLDGMVTRVQDLYDRLLRRGGP